MTKASRSRARRRRLAAHDRGDDRHNRGLSWIKKRTRLAESRRVGKRKEAS